MGEKSPVPKTKNLKFSYDNFLYFWSNGMKLTENTIIKLDNGDIIGVLNCRTDTNTTSIITEAGWVGSVDTNEISSRKWKVISKHNSPPETIMEMTTHARK